MPGGCNPPDDLRIVVTGKGGVGKTTVTAVLAHIFAREGLRVIAVDADPQRNLGATLGLPPEIAEALRPVSDYPDYLREKTGGGPDDVPGGLLNLNPDVSDARARFSVEVAKNLRLLVMGGVRKAGGGCLCSEYTLISSILRSIPHAPDEVILLDTPAGLEHFGRAVADGFTTALILSDPSYNSRSVARESERLAKELGIPGIRSLVNRADTPGSVHIPQETDTGVTSKGDVHYLPADPDIVPGDPSVIPLIDADSSLVRSLKELARDLADGCPFMQQSRRN